MQVSPIQILPIKTFNNVNFKGEYETRDINAEFDAFEAKQKEKLNNKPIYYYNPKYDIKNLVVVNGKVDVDRLKGIGKIFDSLNKTIKDEISDETTEKFADEIIGYKYKIAKQCIRLAQMQENQEHKIGDIYENYLVAKDYVDENSEALRSEFEVPISKSGGYGDTIEQFEFEYPNSPYNEIFDSSLYKIYCMTKI